MPKVLDLYLTKVVPGWLFCHKKAFFIQRDPAKLGKTRNLAEVHRNMFKVYLRTGVKVALGK